MMPATVGSINGFPEACHFTPGRLQSFPVFIQFLFEGFYNILDQDTGGMFGIVNPYRLGFGGSLLRFRPRFPDR